MRFFNPYSLKGYLTLLVYIPTSSTMYVVCDIKLIGMSTNHSQTTCVSHSYHTPTMESHSSSAYHINFFSPWYVLILGLWSIIEFICFVFVFVFSICWYPCPGLENLTSEGEAPNYKYLGLCPTWQYSAHGIDHLSLKMLMVSVIFLC